MRIVLRVLAVLLLLIALLSGGCSLAFGVLAIGDAAGSAILPFVLVGAVVCGLTFLGGRALWRRTRKRGTPVGPDTFR